MHISNFICKDCSCQLNEQIAVKRSDNKLGFRKQCKPCSNKSNLKPMQPCLYCNSLAPRKTLFHYCSIKCCLMFNSKIKNDCWIYNEKMRDKSGYGLCSVNGVTRKSHRVSYEVFKGEIPRNMMVCHSCDNPSCINPDHLWIGTNSENIIDMVKKNRSKQAKLSPDQVIEIRNMYKNDNKFKWIADLFGISDTHITKIIKRLKWKHI